MAKMTKKFLTCDTLIDGLNPSKFVPLNFHCYKLWSFIRIDWIVAHRLYIQNRDLCFYRTDFYSRTFYTRLLFHNRTTGIYGGKFPGHYISRATASKMTVDIEKQSLNLFAVSRTEIV